MATGKLERALTFTVYFVDGPVESCELYLLTDDDWSHDNDLLIAKDIAGERHFFPISSVAYWKVR